VPGMILAGVVVLERLPERRLRYRCLNCGHEGVRAQRTVRGASSCGGACSRAAFEASVQRARATAAARTHKACPGCMSLLPVDRFDRRSGQLALRARCRDCERVRPSRRPPSRADYRALGIRAYGGACVCCGERDISFLQLDHVHNDGAEERRRTKRSPWALARAQGYPPRYQLLCANCNMAKELYGICPHRRGAELVGGAA
jgi:hypothetical protein